MPIFVANNISNGESNPNTNESRIHYLPCKIEGNGEANVSKYFENYIKVDENGAMTASFRGYPLCGKTISLPANHSLIMLTEPRSRPLSSDADRFFKVTAKTREFVCWNWDHTGDPQLLAAMDCFDIAEALCEPVDILEEEMKTDHIGQHITS